MSAYENVVVGKLKLKGKALDVKAGGIKKKKKHNKQFEYDHSSHLTAVDHASGGRLARTANHRVAMYLTMLYHRDRIQGFNQYLANLSEHYDIPKVGPG